MNSQHLIDLEKRYGAHNYKPVPVVIERGEGVFVYFDASRETARAFAFNAPSGRVRVGVPA
ncbi:MAG: hypothetical protein EAZ80_02495, partial [Runella slithyformis]